MMGIVFSEAEKSLPYFSFISVVISVLGYSNSKVIISQNNELGENAMSTKHAGNRHRNIRGTLCLELFKSVVLQKMQRKS